MTNLEAIDLNGRIDVFMLGGRDVTSVPLGISDGRNLVAYRKSQLEAVSAASDAARQLLADADFIGSVPARHFERPGGAVDLYEVAHAILRSIALVLMPMPADPPVHFTRDLERLCLTGACLVANGPHPRHGDWQAQLLRQVEQELQHLQAEQKGAEIERLCELLARVGTPAIVARVTHVRLTRMTQAVLATQSAAEAVPAIRPRGAL